MRESLTLNPFFNLPPIAVCAVKFLVNGRVRFFAGLSEQ